MSFLSRHLRLVVLVVVLVGFAAGGIAYADFPDSNVITYTGCLNVGGMAGGQISQFTSGPNPLKSCGANQQIIHLSGGDITAVRTPPGSGLTGGTENGAASLSLAGSFALPQSCSDQQVPKWSVSSGAWACADDKNTTYSNGQGLDLSNSNTFSVDPSYQLPQGCSQGEVVKSNGDNTWSCQSGGVGGISMYTVGYSTGIGPFYDSGTAYANCNFGDLMTGGGFHTDNVDIKASGPNDYNTGWYAYAEGGLEGGSVVAYVRCMHIQTG
jgi:hypothetical protein